MRERSISEKNFVGAFLGGLLGILSCAYIHPVMMIISCFAGVLIGFWYQEICQIIKTSWREESEWFWEEYNKALDFGKAQLKRLKKITVPADAVIEKGDWLYRLATKIFFWLLTRPAAIVRWIKKHPANRIYLLRAAAIVLYSVINIFVVLIPLFKVFHHAAAGQENAALFFFWLILLAFAATSPVALYGMRGEDNPILKMRYFYRDIEKYDKFGGFYFFIREWTHLHKMQFYLLVVGGSGVICMVAAGLLFLAAFLIPFAAFIGIAKGIYRLAIRPNHWLCLGMTVAVTSVIAALSYQYLSSHAMIWSAALASGVLSGIATEFARKLVARFFQAYRPAYALAAKPVYDQLTPGGEFFNKALGRSFDLLAKHMFKPYFKHWYRN